MPKIESTSIQHRLIAIEGPIGVGKTALAKKLAYSLNYQLLLENAKANPFLKRFYNDTKSVGLQTQLYFLFERVRQLESLQHSDLFNSHTVADFLIDKDQLFAQIALDEDEINIYQKVHDRLNLTTPNPDLVVVLQAPTDVLHARLQQRTNSDESQLSFDYLQKINDSYTHFFHHYQGAPLLLVNSAELDLSNNEDHFQQLLEYLLTVNSGRHYYNPSATK